MAKKQFKAESKRLLDLMINSIYTNKEIYLRELVSNASDALDKRHYLSLTDDTKRVDDADLHILLSVNKQARTFTIEDTGIGMTKEELEKNLGTIAKSGSLEFKKENEDARDIIGQFGVGFYSAFMIARRIEVLTKSVKDDSSHIWTSEGADGYTVEEAAKEDYGTRITLYLRENENEENYDEYLETYKIKQLITRYSDYVRYPIQMDVEVSKPMETEENEEPKYETVIETQTLNTMVPLWKRNKKDIQQDEYDTFYMNKFMDWQKPHRVIHYTTEGMVNYNALLFIPSKTPYDFYSKDYQSGLQLYSKSVFIMDNAKDLIPDYFRFVKGLVDSDDVSLNISREILQQDRQVKAIAKNVEKKIKGALVDMLVKEREEYETFFDNFGLQLKYGIYEDYGIHKEQLQDLILFKSTKEDKYVTLKEYVERMKEGQTDIYFASGESIEQIKKLPQLERVMEKEYEVLYFTDNVDEFMVRVMNTYMEKGFKSINQGDLNIDTEEEKKEKEDLKSENKSLLESLQNALSEKVAEVVLSSRLTSYPVCLSAKDGVSFEMEKVFSQMPEAKGQDIKAQRVLEINPNHDIFKTLQSVFEKDADKLPMIADLLYNQALLIEGFPVEDPVAYSNAICQLLVDANK
ncbi:MAG: molecular chaperone HtpG [Erysipelotrichaceae bacterium]|nr:molecular chaperone HtpG [Erysipelotrichaceae bacterium]